MENIETNVETSETETVPLSTTLYLRNGVGGSVERRQASIRERFEAFRASAEGVDGRVERWAQSVVTPVADGEAASAGAVETYRALAAAVTAAGGRLEPFFQVRDRRGGLLVGGIEGERITFPIASLVVRREEAVTGVYPCWLAGTHHSVEDGLAALEAGTPENLH